MPDALAQEVELGATGDTMADHLDLLDARCVHQEGALHAHATRDASDGDRLVQATVAQAHDGSLEDLDPLTAALDHLDRDAHRVARGDLGNIGPELLALELLDGIHRGGDLVIAALSAAYRLSAW